MRTQLKKLAAIGVDRGGTWTRIAALDARLRPAKSWRFKTGPLKTLPGRLTALLTRWPGGCAAPLTIATRGAFSHKWKKRFLVKALRGKLNLAGVISDAEAAHLAAFKGGPGLLLIAGTGSVAFNGQPGSYKKTGGFGPPSGDPGSGLWLGGQYLKITGRPAKAGAARRGRTAAYAEILLAKAARGDEACALAAAAAQYELAQLLKRAAGGGPGEIRTALAGGLMDCGYFRAGVIKEARRALLGRKLVFIKARLSAAAAAARTGFGAKRAK